MWGHHLIAGSPPQSWFEGGPLHPVLPPRYATVPKLPSFFSFPYVFEV